MYTFAQAYRSYSKHKGPNKYVEKLLHELKNKYVDELNTFDIQKLANKYYKNAKATTKNRQVITPIKAVMYHAVDRGWCVPVRIKKFKEDKAPKKIPATNVWLHTFIKQCDKDDLYHLGTFVLFMNHTGARISEAVRVKWRNIDFDNRTVVLEKTKTETMSTRYLSDILIKRLKRLKKRTGGTNPVFVYTSRFSINEAIKRVCHRAKITYKSSHVCGRHSFATNSLALGMDVRTAMEAGGWKSSVIFLETYVHPHKSGRKVADALNHHFTSEI